MYNNYDCERVTTKTPHGDPRRYFIICQISKQVIDYYRHARCEISVGHLNMCERDG